MSNQIGVRGRTGLTRSDWTLANGLRFQVSNGNSKTGRMLVSKTSAVTCPPGCPFLGSGCYAETAQSGTRVWREISTTESGLTLSEFCARIRALPPDALWRHNEAGDLPGKGPRIAPKALASIAKANLGRRGFTYTHKPITGPHGKANRRAIRAANSAGFTINLSADNPADMRSKVASGVGPVCVVVPTDSLRRTAVVDGTRLVRCPAEYRDTTCRDCGLCARADRSFVIAFSAHGVRKRMVSEIVA